jgi:signal transduction histidine kinase
MLAYLGFRATQESQRSTSMLVEQRTSETVTLMIMALNRDMRAVQGEVLPRLESLNSQAAVYDLADEITTAFARFPYPESFFTWTARTGSPGDFYTFTRSDRPPPWHHEIPAARGFPTVISKNPAALQTLLRLLRHTEFTGSHVLVLETKFNGDTYQIIARARYGFPSGAGIESLAGFLVNLTWVREHYFAELLAQLSNVLKGDSAISMGVFDEKGALVTSTPAMPRAQAGLPPREQHFPLLFFDPLLRTTLTNEVVPVRYWTARAQPLQGESMLDAARGARRTFILIAVAALAASIALILAIISARAAAVLAAMKSEFVSSVTHELKTPLSSIRLASETLVRGRYRSQDVIVEYARLLLNEVSRLTRTVDNLLAITRVQDVSGFYLFEPVDLLTVVEEVLSRFDLQLREQRFDVHLELPPSLPQVYADRAAILQVLDNLIDNAVRYSNGSRCLDVSASSSSDRVSLRISDKGPGIPGDELPRVFDKFFRGRGSASVGSGLGLAIAERILKDHGGKIRLHSTVGSGTTAEVVLPCAAGEEVQ